MHICRLGKWADRNLVEFEKKCRVLQLGRKNPMQQYVLGAVTLESSLAQKELQVPVGTKLKMSL